MPTEKMELIKSFAKDTKPFKKGRETLCREAVANGYKTTHLGLETFLDNCELPTEIDSFYRLCIIS